MTPGPGADLVLLAHMRGCLARIDEYTNGERSRFDDSRLIQDAVIRNLQTLAEWSRQGTDDSIEDVERGERRAASGRRLTADGERDGLATLAAAPARRAGHRRR